MNSLINAIGIVLPVFLVIGLGYLLVGMGFLGPEAGSAMSRLVFYVAAPALLFRGAAGTPLSAAVNPWAMAGIAGVTVLTALAVYLACLGCSSSRRGVLAQGAHRSNMVFVGLPVIENAFGPSVLGPAALLVGFMVPVYNLLAVVLLSVPHAARGRGGKAIWGKALLDVFKNPLIVATLAGIVLSILGIELPTSIDRSLELVARTALPLALLSVGASLDLDRVRAELLPAAAVSIIKLAVYPALIYAVLSRVPVTPFQRSFMVLLFASPTAVVSAVMAQEMRGDEQLAGAIVIASTIASMATLSAWIALLRAGG